VHVVQRLHAEAVARQKERALVAIPHGDREHAAQLLHRRRSVLLVQVQYRFGIAARAVLHALTFELLLERGVIEHLAVVHQRVA
jgi:hypothetical protein